MGVAGPSHVLILLAVLALTALLVIAIVATWRSRALSPAERILLTLILVFMPALGLVAWALFWWLVVRRRSLTTNG